jgi:drug/metabolite transporter (DMT)-like permease
VSILYGAFSFTGNLVISFALSTAAQTNVNAGIVTAIVNGACFFGLIGSYFIFKERISRMQLIGILGTLGGMLLLSLAGIRKQNTIMTD